MANHSTWVGLDVHAASITVAVYRGVAKEVSAEFEVSGDDRGITELIRRLKREAGQVLCVYEAGPCGYALARQLRRRGIGCEVAAPSLIPRKAGERVKTDRRDARKLGRLYRAGELTLVAVPDPAQEALRDLVRAREDVQQDILRRRHRLSRFLLRQGYRYLQGKAWTQRHWRWIAGIRFEDRKAQAVLQEYQISLQQGIDQLGRFNQLIQEASAEPRGKPAVQRLGVLRGVGTVTSLTVVAEVGDLRRYQNAPAFMASTGLVPSEYSSGGKQRRGSITRTGNAHLRRVLVEAAWHYRHFPARGAALERRRSGQSVEAVALARRAELRLHRKYRKLISRGKRPQLAVVAVARELAGFIWALGTQPSI